MSKELPKTSLVDPKKYIDRFVEAVLKDDVEAAARFIELGADVNHEFVQTPDYFQEKGFKLDKKALGLYHCGLQHPVEAPAITFAAHFIKSPEMVKMLCEYGAKIPERIGKDLDHPTAIFKSALEPQFLEIIENAEKAQSDRAGKTDHPLIKKFPKTDGHQQ